MWEAAGLPSSGLCLLVGCSPAGWCLAATCRQPDAGNLMLDMAALEACEGGPLRGVLWAAWSGGKPHPPLAVPHPTRQRPGIAQRPASAYLARPPLISALCLMPIGGLGEQRSLCPGWPRRGCHFNRLSAPPATQFSFSSIRTGRNPFPRPHGLTRTANPPDGLNQPCAAWPPATPSPPAPSGN